MFSNFIQVLFFTSIIILVITKNIVQCQISLKVYALLQLINKVMGWSQRKPPAWHVSQFEDSVWILVADILIST